jgi:hypothetical protein
MPALMVSCAVPYNARRYRASAQRCAALRGKKLFMLTTSDWLPVRPRPPFVNSDAIAGPGNRT